MVVRITTWNVNGIRNPFGYQPWRDKRTFDSMFDILEADIVIMQELKIQRKDLRDDMVLVPGWDCYFSLPKHKKGYSGVGIYARQSVCAPIRAEEGLLGVLCPPHSSTPYCELPEDESIGGYLSTQQLLELETDAAALDAEGRCVVVEFPAFVLFGIYAPANSSGLRDDFRHAFHSALDTRVRNLIKLGKRVIVTGDLNVSRGELDTANAHETLRKEGLTHEDYISAPNRRIFNQLLEGGEVVGDRDDGREEPVLWDTCRGFHPHRKGMYTHWEQKINARPGNFGSRIDFILCSLDMKHWFETANIQEGLMGSDHCPVYAVMKDIVQIDSQEVHLKDVLNPPGTFVEGKRVSEYSNKNVPTFSGRLLPEFDKRRSIKDMFRAKPTPVQTTSSRIPRASTISNNEQNNDSNIDEHRQLNAQESIPGIDRSTSEISKGMGLSPDRKRQATDGATTVAKRSRVLAKSNSGADSTQQSLKGFFVSQSPTKTLSLEKESSVSDENAARHQRKASDYDSNATEVVREASPLDENFVDPIVSKESWGKVFAKKPAPRCEHDEPCKSMKTKIKGFNCGREFWMCARPLGPSGDKEVNTQWRCKTFIWSSDWNGGAKK